jgi:uncharacterized protein with HEPN domain
MRTLAALLDECDLHLLALHEAMSRCPQPLTVSHFETRHPALIAALDQFAYRFIKLQDVMSAKVFRQYAVEVLGEPVESVPVIDILNLLERYGMLPSVSRWQETREIRNQMTHEYQLNPAELIETLQIAFDMVTEMADVIRILKQPRIA